MTDKFPRLRAALQMAREAKMTRVSIKGGLPDCDPDRSATWLGHGRQEHARPDETTEAFRIRMYREANLAGSDMVIFGGLSDDTPSDIDP